jgi:hypothetical protein
MQLSVYHPLTIIGMFSNNVYFNTSKKIMVHSFDELTNE